MPYKDQAVFKAYQKKYREEHKDRDHGVYSPEHRRQYRDDHKVEIAAKKHEASMTEKGKEQSRERNRRYRGKYEGSIRPDVANKYGITVEDYQGMMEAGDGKCYICAGVPQGPRYKALCIDHDHETGKIRGLLCDKCNRGIGLLGDSVETLTKAIGYLESYS